MPVKEIKTTKDFKKLLSDNNLVLVDFFTSWCGPCKAIAPKLEELSNSPECNSVEFAKVNIGKLPDLQDRYSITSVPTFIMFKNGSIVGTVCGANLDQIKTVVNNTIKGIPFQVQTTYDGNF